MKGKMGDRVARERPEGLAERKPKKREAGEGEAFDLPKRRKVGVGGRRELPVLDSKRSLPLPLPLHLLRSRLEVLATAPGLSCAALAAVAAPPQQLFCHESKAWPSCTACRRALAAA